MKSFFGGKENSPPKSDLYNDFNESNEVGSSVFASLDNLSMLSSANIVSDKDFDIPLKANNQIQLNRDKNRVDITPV
jgi:hypothetical protein